jgi:hypothetical protein
MGEMRRKEKEGNMLIFIGEKCIILGILSLSNLV